VFVEGFRLCVALLGTGVGFAVGQRLGNGARPSQLALAGILGCLAGYVLGGVGGRFTDRALAVAESRAERLPTSQLLAGASGAAIGLIGGLPLALPLALGLGDIAGYTSAALVIWICMAFGVRVMVPRADELVAMAGLSTRPLVRATPYAPGDGLLIDSSAVMDGQLVTLARAGLLGTDLLVARFVLDELQGLADGSDPARSRKAQRGLESLEGLRRDGLVRLFVLQDEVPEFDAVDTKLAALAGRLQVRLLTTDANLVRVAEIQGVVTVNLGKVSAELAPQHASGERLRVRLEKDGREPDQGVGYLEDGTMVVVHGGRPHVGGDVIDVVVTSLVPTGRGRIAFARLGT
jgi:uncharacterized protein YacL